MKPDSTQLIGFPRSTQARRLRQGFTLIELLVVIAITAVLFFLLVRPLIESLRLTQRAQLQAAAQDSARKTSEIISRELAGAVYVFDNTSHPFTLPAGQAPKSSDTLFTNFLNLDVPTDPDSGDTNAGKTSVAHAFNAKLDFVPARRSVSGGLIDPTTGDPISATQSGTGSATLNTTGLQFPLAPGTTIIRYFVGLKDPTISYRNTAERLGLKTANNPNNVDNTYILYRVQFSVSNDIDPATKKPVVNPDGTTINEKLLMPKHDANGTAINQPELDDPDFFRYVNHNGVSDVNWLDAAHGNYPAQVNTSVGTPAGHNTRVDNWEKIAKPVITAPNIDLLVLPRYADGTPVYDATTHVASSGSTTDPLQAEAVTPTVKTSINFTPATVTGDAAPSTSSDYGSAGVPMNAADNGGLPYVPTVYTASSQSWGFPPHITLAPQGVLTATTPYYTTDTNSTSLAPTGAASISTADPGDLMEYYHTGTGDTAGKPVYDITKGCVIATAGAASHNYVPMAVNPDTGTLSFDTPALPAPNNQASTQTGGYLPYNRYWTASATDINTGNLISCPTLIGTPMNGTPGLLDLTNLTCDTNGNLTEIGSAGGSNTSPLPKLGATATALQCANAFVVPGSVRVYGPDQIEGPNKGNSILYTLASPTVPLTYNQYRVDYLNSLLTFNVDGGAHLPTVKADNQTSADPVKITFNYQANLAPADNTKQISGANPASPLLVKVDYQTRDLLDVNIGVRVYDPTNGQAFIVPVSNRVKVNNSNR